MERMPHQEVKVRLKEKCGYDDLDWSVLGPKIADLGDELRSALETWLLSGSVPDLEIEGYSIHKLMAEQRLEFVGAIMTLDWLCRAPEAAKRAIKRGHHDLHE